MVPWHLQPKYTANPLPSGAGKEVGKEEAGKEEEEEEGAGRRAGKVKRQKRTRRREHKKRETSSGHSDCCVEGGCGGGDEDVEGWELAGLCLSNEQGGEEASATAWSCPPTDSSDGTALEEQTEATQQPLTGHMTSATPTSSHVTSDALTSCHMTSATPTSGISAQATPTLEELGYQTFHRYYHVFQEGELSELLGEVGGVAVLEEFYDHENWCVLAEKVVQPS